MNFNEVIKIPVPPAPQTDIPAETTVIVPKTSYYHEYEKGIKNYIYLAETVEEMLIVTVYHDGKFMWRTFIDDTDYCTQKAGNPQKSTAGVERISEYGQSYVPVSDADKIILKYAEKYRYENLQRRTYLNVEAGIETVNALQIRIRDKRTAERHRKIREATEECMLEIRPPVKAFTEWIKHQSRDIFVIYHTGDDYGVCTHCLKKVERGKSKWRHREKIVCPHCKKSAVLLCSGRFRDGRIERHTEAFWYAQKTKGGCCARLFSVDYYLCKNTVIYRDEEYVPITYEWKMQIEYSEVGRAFLDLNGRILKGFVWDNFMQTGENYWCRSNDLNYRARFYTGNLRQALSNYPQLKYMPWDKAAKIADDDCFFLDMIPRTSSRPWIEYILKVGLNNLARDFFRYYYSEFFKEISASEFVDGKRSESLAHILGLNRRQLREIIPYDPNCAELKLYKTLLKKRAGLAEFEALQPYAQMYLSDILAALEYQPVYRYMRYVEEQAELYKQQNRGGIEAVISDYADYIEEAKAANYNMEDTATINPKSLIAAHADSEVDSTLERYKQEYAKYADVLFIAAERAAKLKGIIYEDENYRIAPLMSWSELFNESKFLRHCVASYAKKYADGNCIILGVRNKSTPDMPMYTMELSGDLQYISQVRGFKNRSAPEQVMETVKKWHEKLLIKNTEKAG